MNQYHIPFYLIFIFVTCKLIIKLHNDFKESKKKILKLYSSEYDVVEGRIIKKELGKMQYYKCKKYFPYVKYSYSYNNIRYENDKFSFPTIYEYSSNIIVRKILDSYDDKVNVYVDKENPSNSYLEIYDKNIDEIYYKEIDFQMLKILFIVSIYMCIICAYFNVLELPRKVEI